MAPLCHGHRTQVVADIRPGCRPGSAEAQEAASCEASSPTTEEAGAADGGIIRFNKRREKTRCQSPTMKRKLRLGGCVTVMPGLLISGIPSRKSLSTRYSPASLTAVSALSLAPQLGQTTVAWP